MEDCADSSPRNSPTQEGASTLMATESNPGKWTDEKHILFLKSMESMFVKQLYNSIDTFGWHSRKNCVFGTNSVDQNVTSARSPGQFKVLRSGYLSEIYFLKKGHRASQEQESKVPSTRKREIAKSPASNASAPSIITEKQNPQHNSSPFPQDSTGSNTEVMDQNFIDEAFEEDRVGRSTKRTRTSANVVASSIDQVVPFCNNVWLDNAAEDQPYVPPKD